MRHMSRIPHYNAVLPKLMEAMRQRDLGTARHMVMAVSVTSFEMDGEADLSARIIEMTGGASYFPGEPMPDADVLVVDFQHPDRKWGDCSPRENPAMREFLNAIYDEKYRGEKMLILLDRNRLDTPILNRTVQLRS